MSGSIVDAMLVRFFFYLVFLNNFENFSFTSSMRWGFTLEGREGLNSQLRFFLILFLF